MAILHIFLLHSASLCHKNAQKFINHALMYFTYKLIDKVVNWILHILGTLFKYGDEGIKILSMNVERES